MGGLLFGGGVGRRGIAGGGVVMFGGCELCERGGGVMGVGGWWDL